MNNPLIYTYEILPREESVGGGWQLRLLEEGEEVGGGVFGEDEHDDAFEQARAWLNARQGDVREAALSILDRLSTSSDGMMREMSGALLAFGKALEADQTRGQQHHDQLRGGGPATSATLMVRHEINGIAVSLNRFYAAITRLENQGLGS